MQVTIFINPDKIQNIFYIYLLNVQHPLYIRRYLLSIYDLSKTSAVN